MDENILRERFYGIHEEAAKCLERNADLSLSASKLYAKANEDSAKADAAYREYEALLARMTDLAAIGKAAGFETWRWQTGRPEQ